MNLVTYLLGPVSSWVFWLDPCGGIDIFEGEGDPSGLKKEVVQLLLKRPLLDSFLLDSYFQVFNLPFVM